MKQFLISFLSTHNWDLPSAIKHNLIYGKCFFFGVEEKPQAKGISQHVGPKMRHSLNPAQNFHILGASLTLHC